MLRVFTAIKLPHSAVKRIVSSCAKFQADADLRFVESTGLHITLNFVGDVEDRETPALCKAFKNSINDVPDFGIQLHGLGAFPHKERPRVLWVGVREGHESLCTINERFRDVIEDFGFVQEKRYEPHVTIARTKNRSVQPDVLKDLTHSVERNDFDMFQAEEVIVFNSLLEKEGPTYVPLATIQLTG